MNIIDRVNSVIKLGEGSSRLNNSIEKNYFETIKRVDHYINNQYLDGNPGIFWNIINSRIVHTAKNIDLDTKDLQPEADGEVGYAQSWILKMKFYRWLEDNHFALTLNSRSVGLATYGSWIWEIGSDDEIESVPLQNIYFNRGVKCIEDAYNGEGIVRKYFLGRDYIESKGDVWTNTDTLLGSCKDDEIEVWKYNGFVDGEEVEVYGYGYGADFINLYEDRGKLNYYDFHMGEYQGSWLRVGVAERLFDLQVLANKKVNQNDKNQEIASLLLLRSANPEMLGNVLQDVESGEIINSDDLQQIGITNTAFSSFIQEMNQIEDKADQLCLTPDIITGETTPSSMPFRSLATLTNAGKSAFRLFRESIGEATGYLLKERIFPSVVKDWNSGGILEIARDEQDLKYYEESLRKTTKWKTFLNKLLNGQEVRLEDMEEVDKVINENIDRIPKKIKIPENYFNFDFHLRTNITGEAVDKQQRNDALYNAIVWVQSNPNIVNIPYFRQYCEENGINYWRLSASEVEQMKQEQQPQQPPQVKQPDKLLSAIDSE